MRANITAFETVIFPVIPGGRPRFWHSKRGLAVNCVKHYIRDIGFLAGKPAGAGKCRETARRATNISYLTTTEDRAWRMAFRAHFFWLATETYAAYRAAKKRKAREK